LATETNTFWQLDLLDWLTHTTWTTLFAEEGGRVHLAAQGQIPSFG